jgi:hypothetical protein
LDSVFSLNEGRNGGVLSVEDLMSYTCNYGSISNIASVDEVIQIYHDNTVFIENCTFSNNSASESGGIVSASFVTNFTIAYSVTVFESNCATQGGVVYACNEQCIIYIHTQYDIF